MVRIIKLSLLTLLAVTGFAGCSPKTIDQL